MGIVEQDWKFWLSYRHLKMRMVLAKLRRRMLFMLMWMWLWIRMPFLTKRTVQLLLEISFLGLFVIVFLTKWKVYRGRSWGSSLSWMAWSMLSWFFGSFLFLLVFLFIYSLDFSLLSFISVISFFFFQSLFSNVVMSMSMPPSISMYIYFYLLHSILFFRILVF